MGASGVKEWTLRRGSEELQVIVFQKDGGARRLHIAIWGYDDFEEMGPKVARWLAAALVKAAAFVGRAGGHTFKGYRLHGADEDGKPMTFDVRHTKKIAETKRHWRIAGGTFHRLTTVWTKAPGAPPAAPATRATAKPEWFYLMHTDEGRDQTLAHAMYPGMCETLCGEGLMQEGAEDADDDLLEDEERCATCATKVTRLT